MTRARSPGYPNFSLPEAVDRVRGVFDADRQNPIDRETIAKHIGYSGISGASDKAIATLVHYGLLERYGKGEMRVTRLAVDILHPEPGADQPAALREAAFHPVLFAQLAERFPVTPSSDALKSYLKRESFLERAINPVSSAYLETCRYLEQFGAYDSSFPSDDAGPESHPVATQEARTMQPESTKQTTMLPESSRNAVPGADVLNLSGGGQAALKLPDSMTQTEYEDLKDWLDLMARRAKRRVVEPPATEH